MQSKSLARMLSFPRIVNVTVHRIRVLIIEDEPDTRETLCEVLTDNGFEPSAAANGQQALELLRSMSPAPDIILLDMRMPIMDGWDFRHAQLADPSLCDIPVIIVTANNDIQDTARSLHAAGFLRKPVRLEPLLDSLRRNVASA